MTSGASFSKSLAYEENLGAGRFFRCFVSMILKTSSFLWDNEWFIDVCGGFCTNELVPNVDLLASQRVS
ncbi:hypothetical protein Pelo_12789 [Pelomyxa schiedti]|nr:hypothetical protein Pelo_12789 [Pelomyxa schiedti]